MRPGTLLFVGMVVIGGFNFLAVHESNKVAAPFWGSAIRFLLASCVFAALVLGRRLAFPRGRALAGAVVYGVLAFGAGYAFAYQALARIDPGLASIVMATVPLLTLLLGVAHRQERLTPRAVAGALVVLVGMGVVSIDALDAQTSLLGLALMFAAALSAAETGIVIRHFPRVDPAVGNAIGMAVGGALLAVLALVAREPLAVAWAPRGVAAIAYLIVIGSVGLFFLYLALLQRWPASAVSYSFVLTPVIAIALGVAMGTTDPTWTLLAGAALVSAGVYLGALRGPATTPAPATGPRGSDEEPDLEASP